MNKFIKLIHWFETHVPLHFTNIARVIAIGHWVARIVIHRFNFGAASTNYYYN